MASRMSRVVSTARMEQELQCIICLDKYSEPKVAGPCNHSFCRDCLQQYLTSSSESVVEKTRLFNCPMCRRKCSLPPTGVDGLETNRLIVNMIEIISETTKEEGNLTPGMTGGAKASVRQNPCNSCQEAGVETNTNASLICAACEGTRLCDDCGQGHPDEPDTLDHEVTSICSLHGKSLGRFCRTCSKPICIDCSRAKHPKPDHDVQMYRAVINATKPGLLEQVKAARKEIDALVDDKVPMLFQINDKGTADLENLRCEITESIDEEWYRRPQAQTRLIKVRDKILCNLDASIVRQGFDFGVLYTDMTDKQEELSRTMERGERLIEEKILRSGLHEDMVRVTKQLNDMSVDVKRLYSTERTDPLKEVAATKRREFAMSENFLESAGLYSRASLSDSLELPTNHVVLGVTCMSGRRIAVCSGTREPGAGVRMHCPPYALNIWLDGNTSPVSLMTGDDPLVDVTDGKEGKLVVLCQKGPILRVVDPLTKESNAIDVTLPDEEDKKWLSQVQVDVRGQFLVTINNHSHGLYWIMAILPDVGTISHKINVGCHAENLTLCNLTGMLVTCSVFGDTIRTRPWQTDNSIDMSASHGERGFQCSDICSGNLGEIFVVGLMKRGHHPDEIRVYQLDLDDNDKAILLHRVKIKAGQLEMTERCWPKCSLTTEGDCLVICYGEMIKLFELKP